MSFHHFKRIGQGAGVGIKEADPRAAIAEIHSGEIIMAAAKPLIDELVGRIAQFDHIAVRGEGFSSQGLCNDPHQRASFSFGWRFTSL